MHPHAPSDVQVSLSGDSWYSITLVFLPFLPPPPPLLLVTGEETSVCNDDSWQGSMGQWHGRHCPEAAFFSLLVLLQGLDTGEARAGVKKTDDLYLGIKNSTSAFGPPPLDFHYS